MTHDEIKKLVDEARENNTCFDPDTIKLCDAIEVLMKQNEELLNKIGAQG